MQCAAYGSGNKLLATGQRRNKMDAGQLASRFPLGRVLITQGALEALQAAGEDLLTYLRRHAQGDWGELEPHDVAENELALVNGFRLLSAYTLTDGTRIWIITEADRA